jgi:hypothetical protein
MSNQTPYIPPLPPLPPEPTNVNRFLAKQVAGTGPFGLGMGVKREDFEGSLKEILPYKFEALTVPKIHSAFQYYILQITPVQGLSWIKAIGKPISTNPYGLEVQSAFEDFKGKLEKIYGVSERTDHLMYESIWNEPRDWMHAILSGERRLGATWKSTTTRKLQTDLESIYLYAAAENTSVGYIAIEYAFTNKTAADQEIALLEDDAL